MKRFRATRGYKLESRTVNM